MKQKVLKKLGLLALSSIMVAPNVLSGKILENNSKPIGNEKAYPKLSTKDAGKNPKKESTVKAKSGSGFFGKLFKLVGGVVVLNETHNLIRNLIGNPWFCLGMARGLFKQTTEESLTGKVLYGNENTGRMLEYFQRKTTEEYKIENQKELPHESPQHNKMNMEPMPYGSQPTQPTTQTKPIFRGVITPLTDNQIEAECERGEYFAEQHPYLALFILKHFDAMLAMGIDKFRGVKPFDTDSPNPNDQMHIEPLFQSTVQNEGMGSSYIECNGFGGLF